MILINWFIDLFGSLLNQLPQGLVNNTIRRCGKPAVNPSYFQQQRESPQIPFPFSRCCGGNTSDVKAHSLARDALVYSFPGAHILQKATQMPSTLSLWLVLDCVLCSKYSNAYVVFRGRRFLSKFSSVYLSILLSIYIGAFIPRQT